MKKFLWILLVGTAFSQNLRFDNIAIGPRGPVPFATVAVCSQPANTSTTPCSPLASLCSSLSDAVCTSPNPVTADLLGNYHFYVKTTLQPATVQIYGPQVSTPYVMPDQFVPYPITTATVSSSLTVVVTNAAVTGTTVNTLTKLTGAPSTAVVASTSDVNGVQGICISNCTTSGSATIQEGGLASCAFDAATVAGHYIQISSIVAGDCHDSGATYPSAGQIIGRVLSTNGSAGTYGINLFPPEINSAFRLGSIGANLVVGSGGGTGGTVVCAASYTCNMAGGVVQLNVGTAPPSNQTLFQVVASSSVTPFAVVCAFTPTIGSANLSTIQPQLTVDIRNGFVNLDGGATALTASTVYQWAYLCTDNAQ